MRAGCRWRSRVLPPLLGLLALLGCSADHEEAEGRTALRAHDLSAAEAHFRRALEKDPTHGAALAGRGWTYQLAGQRPAARTAFQRCVDLDPQAAECLRGLGSVSLSEGDLLQAGTWLGKASAAAPEDPGVLASQALLDLATGDLEGAARIYESLVNRRPNEAEYPLGLAEVRLRQDKPEEALRIVEGALQLPGTAPRFQGLLWLLQARALVAATAGKEDPARCAETAPPIYAWLDAAAAAVAKAEASGVALPDAPAVRRLVLRRRSMVEEACPL